MLEDASVLEPPRVQVCEAREISFSCRLQRHEPLEKTVEVQPCRIEVRRRPGEEVRDVQTRAEGEIAEVVVPTEV